MSTFKLPDLGEGLAEAEILEWHVKPGDVVRIDQPMLSVETAKAVVEVPVPFNGTVLALHGAVGDMIATGAPLVDFDSGTVVGRIPTPEETTVDRLVRVPVNAQDGTTVGPRTPGNESRFRAVPAARAVARELGVDLAEISGSGTAGLITLTDVLRRADLAAPGGVDIAAHGGGRTEPLQGSRRTMARSMSASHGQVAASTVFDDADIHSWAQRGDYMSRLIRALIAACAVEPALNAWYDARMGARILFESIDLAIAVDTPGGLIVPVLRNVGAMTPQDLRAAVTERKDAAHQRRLTPEDLRNFTLMLSNFGTLAGRYGIPLVVPPAVAILGAGKVRTDAVVVDEAVVAHRRIPLSLSFDHRCVTGGEACRFLAAVIADLEKPN
jgi:2-oxoisovalerate dehydrogenase E2 component (dihydrolipoyl transacylase)